MDANDSEGGIGSKTEPNVLVPFQGVGMEMIASNNHTRVNRGTKLCVIRRKRTGTPRQRQKPSFYEDTSAKLGFPLPATAIPLPLQVRRTIPTAIRTGKFALLSLNSKLNRREGCRKSSYMVGNFLIISLCVCCCQVSK